MSRNKGFSATNLVGLTIGMTCTILIMQWVQDELSWNGFHRNKDQVYKVLANRDFNGEINTDIAVPFPMAEALRSNFPEVKHSTVVDFGRDMVIAYNNTIMKKRAQTVGVGYFDVFHWEFIKGTPATAFSDPSTIVLTESMAKAVFGNEEPMGKIVKTDNADNRKVTGIIRDVPANSTLRFDCIIPFNYSDGFIKESGADWVNSFTETYVELAPGTDAKQLQKKISAMMATHAPQVKADFLLYPMSDWRLYSDFKNGKNTGGMIEYVRLFSIIALIILLIACVNFMNLYTARSEKRAREVGIRKTLGSERSQLLWQFYSEAVIFSLMAFVFSVILVMLVLPSFNQMIGKELHLQLTDPVFLASAFVLVLFTGFVSGSYPALYLSSFSPVKVLKGTFLPGKKAALPRRMLVVLQFIISIFLISATILVYQQIQHVKNRQLGYDPNNLISIPSSPEANRNAEVIRNEMMQSNLVASVTRTSSPITEIWNYTPAPDYEGKPGNGNMIMTAMRTDADFTKTLGAKIIEGRDFDGSPSDSSSMLLNQAAVEMMQLKDPIGKQMRYGPARRNYNVVGVTDNLVMSSPYAPVMPMMVLFEKNYANFFLVRLKKGVEPREALARIGTIFKKYNPDFPFEYKFTDEQFNKKFLAEDLIGRLTNLFAGLAIFICCLGLSGLTSFTIERRLKEIGIRKILGASVKQLVLMISKEFLLLVFLAFLISVPIAWYLLHNWLQHYEYRVGMSIWLFIASGAGVLLLTLITVCLNSVKAAVTNPVRNLRSE
jgi:ABC-type antimicrobial peptide transport system permease subunit